MAFKCDIPAVPTALQDDDDVHTIGGHFAQGAVTGSHHREWPYFVVLRTESRIRVHDGGEVLSFSTGHSYMHPAGVTHDIMNGGDEPMASVEIEVKSPDQLAI